MGPGGALYICPMPPPVRPRGPGTCPICGMALEPETLTALPEDNTELRDLTRRFWWSAALPLPTLLLGMSEMRPASLRPELSGTLSSWWQLGLSAPVVLWG